MVDEASVGGQNGWQKEGYDPLIIFDSSTLSTNNVREISKIEESRAKTKDMKWRQKVNSSKNSSAMWSDTSSDYLAHNNLDYRHFKRGGDRMCRNIKLDDIGV